MDEKGRWTQLTQVPWPPRNTFSTVVFKENLWVMGGNTPGGMTNDVWRMELK